MIKVSGTFDRAFGCLTVGQYTNARRDLMQALGLDLNSRSAFGKYLNGTTALKSWQIQTVKATFAKYGIDWEFVEPQRIVVDETKKPAGVISAPFAAALTRYNATRV